MSQVNEDTDEDLEAGYISSDESGHGVGLVERLRIKPSADIWELGNIYNFTFFDLYLIFGQR